MFTASFIKMVKSFKYANLTLLENLLYRNTKFSFSKLLSESCE